MKKIYITLLLMIFITASCQAEVTQEDDLVSIEDKGANNMTNTNTNDSDVAPTPEPSKTQNTSGIIEFNHLKNESSPYLQQHAKNPVDWYPYGNEAFEKAKSENKLIFLSIGYSTCHWCHVMKRESFEDLEVAQVLNDHFIAIKVDREERPDVDSYYMDLYQNLSGSGGWPLTIILTPDQEMVYGATYLPKDSFADRVGLMDTLISLESIWRDDTDKIYATAKNISSFANELFAAKRHSNFDPNLYKDTMTTFTSNFDSENGGFSTQPKFPSPHYIDFLLNKGDGESLDMAYQTLDAIILGGIHDQLAGGFHRYTVDKAWRVPHFEKMLYDQAGLLSNLSKAYQLSKNSLYKESFYSTISFVSKNMSKGNLFYSAIDAESEGVEGKYYLWSIDEVVNLLDNDEVRVLGPFYSLEDEGNYHDEVTMDLTGLNILYRHKDSNAQVSNLTQEDKALLESGRNKLLTARDKRIPPHMDEKILTDWNAYYIKSMLEGALIFQDTKLIKEALRQLDNLEKTMYDPLGNLFHNRLGSELGQEAFLDDYAYLLSAYFQAYTITLDYKYVEKSIELSSSIIENFWSDDFSGFMFSEDKDSITYRKKFIDGAYPSGYSVLIDTFNKMSLLTGDTQYLTYSQRAAKAIAETLNRSPFASLKAIDFINASEKNTVEIIIVKGNDDNTEQFLSLIRNYIIPNSVIILKTEDNTEQLKQLMPFTETYTAIGDQTTVYICQNTTCKLPVFTRDNLEFQLNSLNNDLK